MPEMIERGVPVLLEQLVGVLRLGRNQDQRFPIPRCCTGATFCVLGSPLQRSFTPTATFVSPSRSWPWS